MINFIIIFLQYQIDSFYFCIYYPLSESYNCLISFLMLYQTTPCVNLRKPAAFGFILLYFVKVYAAVVLLNSCEFLGQCCFGVDLLELWPFFHLKLKIIYIFSKYINLLIIDYCFGWLLCVFSECYYLSLLASLLDFHLIESPRF